MGIVSEVRSAREQFGKGFSEGFGETDPEQYELPGGAVGRIGSSLTLFSRVILYGFLISAPGVPFLPWGHAGLMAATTAAGAMSSVLLVDQRRWQIARAIAVSAIVIGSMRLTDGPFTSYVLIGAFVSALGGAAQNAPFLYGLVGGMSAMAFLRTPTSPDDHMLLSVEPWTEAAARGEALRFAGLIFLIALMHFGRWEMKRLATRAKTAEVARDSAVADERARIARELHDVVSHHVTAMTLQAEAASMTGDKQALGAVATAGREALVELRRMLGVLRHPDDAAPSVEPQPGLADLDRLAARTSSGPKVTVDKRGTVRDLPAGVELGIFRIVQEAITNTAKHGDATAVDVVLNFGPDMVTVEIRDNGRPLSAPRVRSSGLGLIGMNERVALLDGELTTGPRADADGFEVIARFPVES